MALLPLLGGRFGEEVAGLFPDPDDLRDFTDGTDFTYGLAGRRDAEVEEACDSLQGIIEAAAADKLFELGVAVALPFTPFGTTLGFVPLPPALMAALAGITLVYLATASMVRRWVLP